jgi:hypothetical protein
MGDCGQYEGQVGPVQAWRHVDQVNRITAEKAGHDGQHSAFTAGQRTGVSGDDGRIAPEPVAAVQRHNPWLDPCREPAAEGPNQQLSRRLIWVGPTSPRP